MVKKTKKKSIEKIGKKEIALSAPLFKQTGEKIGRVKLNAKIFGNKINEKLMTQAVGIYLTNQRKGSASTKTRGEVAGGGAKPWRQKGLGRARAGSSRMPHWRGGGVVHGPKPKTYALSLTKKMRRSSLFSALSAKAKDEGIVVIDDLKFKEPKTKLAAKTIAALPVKEKKLVVIESKDENIQKSLRNLSGAAVEIVQNLNTHAVISKDTLILTKNVLDKMENLYIKEK